MDVNGQTPEQQRTEAAEVEELADAVAEILGLEPNDIGVSRQHVLLTVDQARELIGFARRGRSL